MEVAAVLALSGGLMDAYSYLGRGEVFANAQTGNMLLLGVNLAQANWERCAHYALPICGFALGVVVAHNIKLLTHTKRLHWRQLVLIVEALILVCVSAMGGEQNLLANSLTSFACGLQVQAFRKLHGKAIATTMCIGNLRSGTQELVTFVHTQERERLQTGLLYYSVIACFVLGAVLGNWLLGLVGLKAILGSTVLLACTFFIMFIDREKRSKKPVSNAPCA